MNSNIFAQVNGIKTCIEKNEFSKAEQQCEQALAQQPEAVSLYWYLGLSLLLQQREEEAQFAWMSVILEADTETAEEWGKALAEVLEAEARRREEKREWEQAWLIRRHLREINREEINNALRLIALEIKTPQFSFEGELFTETLQILQERVGSLKIDEELLLNLISELLTPPRTQYGLLKLVESSIPYFENADTLLALLLKKTDEYYRVTEIKLAAELSKLCVRLAPDNLDVVFKVVPCLLSNEKEDHSEGIRLAKKGFYQARNLAEKIDACHGILSGLASAGGRWEEAREFYKVYKSLLVQIPQATEEELPANIGFKGLIEGVFFYYFEDNPEQTRPIRNQVAQAFEHRLRDYLREWVKKYQFSFREQSHRFSSNRRLKIAYLSECLRLHSVGWLARWLIRSHDSNQFEVHLYSCRSSNDMIQSTFANEFGDHFHDLSRLSIAEMAESIYKDEIDILVELDSLTAYNGCAVTALKPAPIQVNWLGSDASGLPAIDYFIADRYVLPESAPAYYQEKIWRLPNCYVGVNGFEASTPSLSRDELEIPRDAVVYLSAQTGLKRNPQNVRSQMKILRAVPNSYFLIKTITGHDETIEQFFYQLADEEGVSRDQLRFLSMVSSSMIHRANLAVADVVLDTYPYNGATTTLETLWMEVPLVTRVGNQFTARNSYTMLMNVGVTEGIAWSDEEYIEWGIRLGKDEGLRWEVMGKLRKSKHHSPLWNGKQFAREMENAYQQMWERYVEERKAAGSAETL